MMRSKARPTLMKSQARSSSRDRGDRSAFNGGLSCATSSISEEAAIIAVPTPPGTRNGDQLGPETGTRDPNGDGPKRGPETGTRPETGGTRNGRAARGPNGDPKRGRSWDPKRDAAGTRNGDADTETGRGLVLIERPSQSQFLVPLQGRARIAPGGLHATNQLEGQNRCRFILRGRRMNRHQFPQLLPVPKPGAAIDEVIGLKPGPSQFRRWSGRSAGEPGPPEESDEAGTYEVRARWLGDAVRYHPRSARGKRGEGRPHPSWNRSSHRCRSSRSTRRDPWRTGSPTSKSVNANVLPSAGLGAGLPTAGPERFTRNPIELTEGECLGRAHWSASRCPGSTCRVACPRRRRCSASKTPPGRPSLRKAVTVTVAAGELDVAGLNWKSR